MPASPVIDFILYFGGIGAAAAGAWGFRVEPRMLKERSVALQSPLRHSHGHIRDDGKDLYVTAGLGTSILPVRFNIRPEIAF